MATPILALIPSGYKSEKVYSVLPSNGDGDFTFTREGASGQPNSTRVNKDGLIEVINSNVPRLDYSDGSCPSLLLESQSTNTINNSNTVASLQYNSQTTRTDNVAISPDGTFNAMGIVPTITQGIHRSGYHTNASSYSQNDIVTFSGFVKANGYDFVTMGGFFGGEKAVFNISNGTLVSQESNVINTEIVKLTNDWYRLSTTYTFQNHIGNNYLYAGVWVMDSETGYAFTGDGVSGVYAYGFQAEIGTGTSYIPTDGAIATRLADQASNDFSSQPTVANTSTVVLKFIPMGFDTDFYDLLKFSDGTNDLRLEGFQTNNYDVYGSGLSTSGMIDGALQLDAGSINTISFSYSGTNIRFSHNGSTIATTTPTGNLPTITEILHTTGGLSPIKILKLEVYNDFKTQEELNSLTNSN